jgi:quercetin dioxygenase-like cupin family protein
MHTVINPMTNVRVDLFGPMVEFLTPPQAANSEFCVLRGVIPPGCSVPLHSHPDTEDFFIISGEVQALRQGADGYEWIGGKAGDFVHVPGGARHAWRNISSDPFVALIVTTTNLGRYFLEAGRPLSSAPQPVTPADIARLAATSAKYGYWDATPEENAQVGLRL